MRLTLTKDLAPLRAAAKARVDEGAETFRLTMITPGAGQSMTYEEKYREALMLLDNPNVSPAELPHIYGEVGITGDTAFDVAAVVVAMRNQWKQVSSLIETTRLGAKAAIDRAATPADIEAACAVAWSGAMEAHHVAA